MNPDQLSGALLRARRQCLPLSFSEKEWRLALEDGYDVQRRVHHLQLNDGARQTGWKIALAGRAGQRKFGLSEPVYGALTDRMCVVSGGSVHLGELIKPNIEAELAVVFGKAITGKGLTDEDIVDAISLVAPSLEIADCRWAGWRFDAGSFVADNAAAGLYCLGPARHFDAEEVMNLDYRLERDGAELGSGTGVDAISGALANCIWLARHLLEKGEHIEPGQVVLSGALMPPIAIAEGQYRLRMLNSSVNLRFVI